MKKVFKVIGTLILWSIISLAIEFGAFYYINNVFLKQNGSTEITPIDLDKNRDLKSSTFDVPSGADINSFKFSDDNLYMAFTQDGALKVEELSTGKVNTVLTDSSLLSGTVNINGKQYTKAIYNWIPDRDRLLLAYPSEVQGTRTFKLYSYDAINNAKRDENRFSKYFSSISSDRYITALSSSGTTGSTYVKIDGGNRYSKIYYYDIDSDVYPVEVGSKMIDNMAQLQHQDKLFFSDSTHSGITLFNNSSVGSTATQGINFIQGLRIIGSNTNDNVYAAKTDESGMVSKIYYTNPDGTNFYEQSLPSSLGNTVYYKSLFIKPHGGVYVNDTNMSNVINTQDGTESNYEGTLLQITDKYMICYQNQKIMFEKLK